MNARSVSNRFLFPEASRRSRCRAARVGRGRCSKSASASMRERKSLPSLGENGRMRRRFTVFRVFLFRECTRDMLAPVGSGILGTMRPLLNMCRGGMYFRGWYEFSGHGHSSCRDFHRGLVCPAGLLPMWPDLCRRPLRFFLPRLVRLELFKNFADAFGDERVEQCSRQLDGWFVELLEAFF